MEYGVPVRVFWEVDAGGEPAFRILDDLVDSRVFFVALAFRGDIDASLMAAAAERLPAVGARLTIECRPPALPALLQALPRRGVASVHVDVTDHETPSLDLLRAVATAAREGEGAPVAGLKIELWGREVPRVPALLDACRESGLPRLVLANARVVEQQERGADDALRHASHAALEHALQERRAWLSGIDVVIHDLFVWKLFARCMEHPPTRGEYAGCQAYNALGYIAPSGELYGCQTLRTPVGSLHRDRLRDLWNDPKRRLIRRMLEAHPEKCRTCVHYLECKSGCRGMVEFIHGDYDEADPSCPFYTARAPVR